jgi:hypothetical protein
MSENRWPWALFLEALPFSWPLIGPNHDECIALGLLAIRNKRVWSLPPQHTNLSSLELESNARKKEALLLPG